MVRSESNDPARFKPGAVMHLDDGSTRLIQKSRTTEAGAVIRFDGVDDRNAAEALRGLQMFVTSSSRRQLGADEFWPDELVGLSVVSAHDGHRLGAVVDYVEGVGQDRLVVDGAYGRFEIPFVRDLVPVVDIAAGEVRVVPLDGLMG